MKLPENELMRLPPEQQKAEWKRIKAIRSVYKPVNYSAVYGIGATKLSRSVNTSMKKASNLLEHYWERNWAVKELVKHLHVRSFDGEMWVLNPVNGFYYSLRFERDKFSTLNQGTGVFIFDSWVKEVKNKEVNICGQFHDEIAAPVENEEETRKILLEGIEKVNEKDYLCVPVRVDVKFGQTYAEVH